MIQRSAVTSEARNVASTPTALVLLGASVAMATASLLANLATFETDELSLPATVTQAMHASTVATLVFALIAGIVGATADIRFGRIDQLLLTDPRPSSMLSTKALVAGGLGVLYGVTGSAVTVVTTRLFFASKGVAIDLGSELVVRPLVGVVVGAGLFCAMGVGLGYAIRNQPFAIGVGLALLLIIQPPMLLGVPSIGRWLPGAAGLSLTVSPDPELTGQVTGGALALLWAGTALAAGLWRLRTERAAG